MCFYEVKLSNGKCVTIEADSWVRAGALAAREHGGKVTDVQPLPHQPGGRKCEDIVEVSEACRIIL